MHSFVYEFVYAYIYVFAYLFIFSAYIYVFLRLFIYLLRVINLLTEYLRIVRLQFQHPLHWYSYVLAATCELQFVPSVIHRHFDDWRLENYVVPKRLGAIT
jgi:hypothetical protein